MSAPGSQSQRMDQEVKHSNWNVQRILLLAGFIWISLGIGSFVLLKALLAHPENLTDLHPGFEGIGIAPLLIGFSHLIVYLVGRKKES
jgi:hypothetical protein